MKHAFIVLAHGNTTVLEKCMRVLDDTRFDFYIHIDKKTELTDELCNRLRSSCVNSNVYILDNRVSVIWGYYSMSVAEFNLMTAVVDSNCDYDYVHLISGSDFPLMTPNELDSFFEINKGKEFVRIWGKNGEQNGEGNWRMNYRYPFLKFFKRTGNKYLDKFQKLLYSRILRFPRKKGTNIIRDANYKVYSGDQWFSFTGDFVKYMVSQKEYLFPFCKDCYIVDESIPSTLIRNTAGFKDHHCNFFTRKIDWTRGRPYVWEDTEYDYKMLIDSKAVFARKFSVDQIGIVDKLAEELERRKISGTERTVKIV